ncbi:hypothetical protein [Streptomyces sp. NPDC058297]|uniref:hypothetical protein n=1 Tax=Streptomyces sp. NPDC058297 TaxID=3346433 RepID=UPI0036E73332
MNPHTPAHMHAPAWSFGDRRVWKAENPADQDRLDHERLAGYFHSELLPWQLAVGAATQTLEAARVAATDVDLIVYASESTDSRVDLSRDPNRFAEAIGAPHVHLVGATANVCANFGAALRIARDAIRTGDAENVLVVTTDVWDDRSRLVDAGTCLMSDAAASVMVSAARPDDGWLIGGVFSAVDHTMHSVDPAQDTIAMVRGTAGGMRRAADGFFAMEGHRREDYPFVVAGNVGTTVLRVLAASAQLDLGRVFARTAENGHCFAADVIVNMTAIQDTVPAGTKVLGLSTGHNYWICVDFERIARQPTGVPA